MDEENIIIEEQIQNVTENCIYQPNLNSNSNSKPSTNLFDFINDQEKFKLLTQANEGLNINKNNHNKIIFVYSAPKVGSTSIVSSLRIFGSNRFTIIHIHDEVMLNVLGHIKGITINELILFNKYLGKDVYVIDIYRSPIERKISVFFEKIGSYHFNNVDAQVNNYNIGKVINRFNNIFEHIGIGDHFMDKYNINIPEKFDYTNKYVLVVNNNIKYIKLRLKDSNYWGNILSKIFKTKICIVKDYESIKKPIKNIYTQFKTQYKIPKNYLENLMNCKYLNYYYSEEEKRNYFNEWSLKSSENTVGYSLEHYRLYHEISMENCHINKIQLDHYIDEGCLCKACNLKRREIATLILRGFPIVNRIVHTVAKTEFLQKRTNQFNKINKVLSNMPKKQNVVGYKPNLKTIVKN
jgi:hypothetical protein